MIKHLLALLVALPVSPADAAPFNIRVGVIQSLTGPAEEDGHTILKALRLAADDLNAKGKFHVSLVVEDDGTVPKNTVSAYEKLKREGIKVIVGPSWSFLVQTLVPLAARDKIVLFSTSNSPEVLKYKEANGMLFSNSFPIKGLAAPLRSFLSSRLHKKAAFIRTQTIWAEAHRDALAPVLEASGITLDPDALTPAVSNNDFRDLLPRLKRSGVDLLILLLSRDDSETLLRRADEINFQPGFFAAAHTYDAVMRTKDPELYEGLCLAYPYHALHSAAGFAKAYKDHYGQEPRIYANTSYDALFILAEAFRASSEAQLSFDTALRGTRYAGVAGEYAFSEESSFSVGRNDLLCIEGGKPLIVGP